MDDDIRDRFRSSGRSARPDPYGYGRSSRPAPRPAAQPPRPQVAPVPTAQQQGPLLPSNSQPPQGQPVANQADPMLGLYAPAKPKKQKKVKKPKQKRAKRDKTKKTKKGRAKKFLLILLALLMIGALGYGGYRYYKSKSATSTPSVQTADQPVSAENKRSGTVRMVAVGDSLAFESLTNTAKQPDGSYDYSSMMSNFRPYFEKADVRICNQTTPGGGQTDGLALSGYPSFNGPLGWNTSFAKAGCNVMNLASEHTNDKGQVAINNMLKTWGEQKDILAIAGANNSTEEQAKIRYTTVKGVKIAYLAYTTTGANKDGQPYGVNIYSDAFADQQITEARKNAHLIVVSMNWGTEGVADISADQDRIAQHLADLNVDVVLGGGPRLLQPVKILNGKDGHQSIVWFSLGNFLNSMTQSNNLVGGMAIMEFDANSLQLNDPELMPVYMHYEWTAQQKASNTLAARTNFKLYPLDQAEPLLPRSQLNTTVAALTGQATATITKFAPIKVIKSSDL